MIMEQKNPGKNEEQQEQQQKPHIIASYPDDENDENFINNNDKQIVLYNPPNNQPPNDVTSNAIVPVSIPESVPKPMMQQQRGRVVLPGVGSFTVQCAVCFKWRLMPSKEKYEEIRENILTTPFTCELAKEWRPELSCDVPADIEQDNSRLWAIDKPSIAKPPPGWERDLRIRAEGGSKFADVYYCSPTGKKLRSMVEVTKYLEEHPEYIRSGVRPEQFSFQIPKPLQENYVRKRPTRVTAPSDEPVEASPLSWAAPADGTTLQLGGPGLSSSYSKGSPSDVTLPARKKSRSSENRMFSSDPLHMRQRRFNIRGPSLPPNGVYDL